MKKTVKQNVCNIPELLFPIPQACKQTFFETHLLSFIKIISVKACLYAFTVKFYIDTNIYHNAKIYFSEAIID